MTVSHRGVYKGQELRILEREKSQGLRTAFGRNKAQRPVSGVHSEKVGVNVQRADNVPFLSFSELNSSKQNQKIGKRWRMAQGEASEVKCLLPKLKDPGLVSVRGPPSWKQRILSYFHVLSMACVLGHT